MVSVRSVPSAIHSVRPRGSPLSKTELLARKLSAEERERTNGAAAIPSAPGSLESVIGSAVSRSPTLVPPPGLLKTVRPSWLRRASTVRCW
ncbi:hypothetical protein SAMN06297387_10126 [Streptomyces zhaozhouensis]|uniref:Uncharacterized protein n=1 Tax=Streptomyces zhaozhouensis TaxID=1300267 RepID=A0A286DHS9_9ACTN|nr:hypothetical protein SAMN06297387_10126 [Streptomyces zhaozhouensis]